MKYTNKVHTSNPVRSEWCRFLPCFVFFMLSLGDVAHSESVWVDAGMATDV